MRRIVHAFCLTMVGLIPSSGQAAQLNFTTTTGPAGSVNYIFNSVVVSPAEVTIGYNTRASGATLQILGGGLFALCASANFIGVQACINGRPPAVQCNTAADALTTLQSFMGYGAEAKRFEGGVGMSWTFSCKSSSSAVFYVQGVATNHPTPVSCTTSPVEVRLLGRVGAEATDSQNVYVSCDSKASIKLTIPDAGMVKVSGGGEVQLKFPLTGEAVRFSTGIDHHIALSARLTKSPTTAGTYTGSTVLLLDVL